MLHELRGRLLHITGSLLVPREAGEGHLPSSPALFRAPRGAGLAQDGLGFLIHS
jgi:hypothetical protein